MDNTFACIFSHCIHKPNNHCTEYFVSPPAWHQHIQTGLVFSDMCIDRPFTELHNLVFKITDSSHSFIDSLLSNTHGSKIASRISIYSFSYYYYAHRNYCNSASS